MDPWRQRRLFRFPLAVLKAFAGFRVRHEIFGLPPTWYLVRRLRPMVIRRFLKVL